MIYGHSDRTGRSFTLNPASDVAARDPGGSQSKMKYNPRGVADPHCSGNHHGNAAKRSPALVKENVSIRHWAATVPGSGCPGVLRSSEATLTRTSWRPPAATRPDCRGVRARLSGDFRMYASRSGFRTSYILGRNRYRLLCLQWLLLDSVLGASSFSCLICLELGTCAQGTLSTTWTH